MRKSTKEEIRVFSNDYEFYESLPTSIKEEYWQKDSHYVIGLMIALGVVMNLSLLFDDALHAVVFMIVGMGVVCFAYGISYHKLYKQMKFIRNENNN